MILGITRDSILAEQQFQQELAAMVEKFRLRLWLLSLYGSFITWRWRKLARK